jgi:NADH-quinone oxidoreductase subunit G
MVVVMSPFKHGMAFADVLLPVAPFTETAGTFISAEGRVQSFNGSVKPLGETRPAWKVLRVLGNLLSLDGFAYESSEDIRNEVLGVSTLEGLDLTARLNNHTSIALKPMQASTGIERIADVPVYFSDAIVRRAGGLQETTDARSPRAVLSTALAEKLGVISGAKVRVSQGTTTIVIDCAIDNGLPDNVVRVASAHPSTAALGPMFGVLSVEKV